MGATSGSTTPLRAGSCLGGELAGEWGAAAGLPASEADSSAVGNQQTPIFIA